MLYKKDCESKSSFYYKVIDLLSIRDHSIILPIILIKYNIIIYLPIVIL